MPIEIQVYFLVWSVFCFFSLRADFRKASGLNKALFNLLEVLALTYFALAYWLGPRPHRFNPVYLLVIAAILVRVLWEGFFTSTVVNTAAQELPKWHGVQLRFWTFVVWFVIAFPTYYFAVCFARGLHPRSL